MKKHDEGYTLPFVLVVLTILFFVVSIVLTSAETTVVAQQKSIAQMKEKYAAQGKIEMLVGQLCEEAPYANMEAEVDGSVFSERVIGICESMKIDENEKITPVMNGDDVDGIYVPIDATSEFTYTFTVKAVYHSVEIESRMTLTGTISETTGGETTTYSITDLSVSYESYQIGGDAP